MMRSMNRVFLMGRLGHAPELKEAKSGRSYARLRVATNRWVKDVKDSAEGGSEKVEWHSVFVWGREAELCSRYLTKGSLVFVEGSLSYWQIAQDQSAVYKNAIHGHRVQFLSAPKAAEMLIESENLDNLEEPRNHNAVAHL